MQATTAITWFEIPARDLLTHARNLHALD
jgi:hypothetical protein